MSDPLAMIGGFVIGAAMTLAIRRIRLGRCSNIGVYVDVMVVREREWTLYLGPVFVRWLS